jgi:cytochrome b pre-mRNA-processing protein 3
MFSFYKKHNNKLYNKLSDLSRNKFLYEEIKLADNFETRILLIFFHLSIILKIAKGTGSNKKTQDIYDNIFQNIEYHIRELGYGDVSVNKNMKNMNKIFYDILYSLDKETSNTNISKKLLEKYFNPKNNSSDVKISKLADYLVKFQNFCFDLDVNIMLNGSIDFKYR